MVVDIIIGIESDEKDFKNGINLKINRGENDSEVTIRIVCDAEELILPEFLVDYNQLKKAILLLGELE